VQLRTAPGEVHHFSSSASTTYAVGTEEPHTYTVDSAFTLVTETVNDDNSANVRGWFDDVSVTGLGRAAANLAEWVNAEFTYRLHPDGSITDFEMDVGEAAAPPARVDSFPTFGVPFPEDGLLVGESFDTDASLPFLRPSPDAPKTPVHTTLQELIAENDRPAARLVQTLSVPKYETPIGPFGSVGTVNLSMDGKATQVIDLESGWPLRTEGSVSYRVVVTGQGGQRSTVEGHSESSLAQRE
jgi:hypothetical protein